MGDLDLKPAGIKATFTDINYDAHESVARVMRSTRATIQYSGPLNSEENNSHFL